LSFERLRKAALAAAALVPLALCAPAFAQSGADRPDGGQAGDPPAAGGTYLDRPYSLTIGAGAAYLPSYEGSNDYVVSPAGVAFGKVDGFSFSTRGTSLNIDLIRGGQDAPVTFELGPVVNLRSDRHGRIVDPQVAALGRIGRALEVGGYVGVGAHKLIDPYDSLSFRLTYQRDVTGTHNSGIWIPEVQYLTPVSVRTVVILDAQASRVGDRYARVYFGVTPLGALASGLPAYNAHGGWKDYRLSLLVGQVLVGDLRRPYLSLFAGISYSRELGNFGDSPVVSIAGSRNQYLAAGGLAYSF
jgi:outer membrane scaffolding protein for murein synthesis (MipA/OmpV family)